LISSQAGIPNVISGIIGLGTGLSSTYAPNLIKTLQTNLVISSAVFAFYFTDGSTNSYFDIGRIDQTAMLYSANLFM
jgi:uncharacterized membrane protein YfcA